MKHIRYQFLALLSVSALTFTSCDLIGSIDDMEPDYVVTDLNYITDATSAQTALNGLRFLAQYRCILLEIWYRLYGAYPDTGDGNGGG